MGTLKTTINLNSTDILPFSINQNIISNSSVGNFVETGIKNIKTFSEEFFFSGDGNLTYNNCGPHGAYVMINNPSTNVETVKVYGLQQITEEMEEPTQEGIESFATLKPGDSILVNISPQQSGVFLATTFGSANIEYLIADRGGDFGENVIFVDTNGQTMKYVVLDSQVGEVLPAGYPIPYWSGKDLGIYTSAYTYHQTYVINNIGYVLRFLNILDNTNSIWAFIDARGEFTLIEHTGDFQYSDLDQFGFSINFDDYFGTITLYNFDGFNLYSHTISGASPSYGSDWDATSSDGSFMFQVNDYLGNSGDIATLLINKNKVHVLQVLNTSSDVYTWDNSVSFYGSFIFMTLYNTAINIYTKFQIWSTNGTLLHSIDVSDYEFNNLDYVFYGNNKLQAIFSDANYDYIINFNGITNKLIGFNKKTNLLNIIHENTGNYSNRRIYGYSKYPNNSIRPWYYNWNSGVFDADSIAIVYSDSLNNNSDYHVNTELAYCDIVYMLEGQSTYTTYKFANDETKFIRLPSVSGEYRITPSSNLIAFTYGETDYTTGALNVLTITSAGVSETSLISNLGAVSNEYYDIVVKPVGEYVVYGFYTTADTTTFVMVKNSTTKDSFTTLGNVRYNIYYRVNSIVIYGNDEPKLWYFNTVNNKFTEIVDGYFTYDDVLYNKSVTTNGLNDGNMLLIPNTLNSETPTMRILKKGVLSSAVTLPSTDANWSIYLGSNAVFLSYQDMDDMNKYKVNVYDLNLTLVRTVSLLTSNIYVEIVGKRAYFKTYDADQLGINNLHAYYVISLDGVAYWAILNMVNPIFNDKYWWNYSY
jgi:hypothetical protein